MPAHANGTIPNAHQRKHWMQRIHVDFKKPFRAKRRHANRVKKARKFAPKPIGLLRPIVRPSCIKHSHKLRIGQGFTKQELRMAKLSLPFAKQFGIAVDKRRKNKSIEATERNVERLKEYKAKLIIFPKSKKKTLKGEASPEEIKMATQYKGKLMPLPKEKFELEEDQLVNPKLAKVNVFSVVKQARVYERKWGIRAKKAAEAAAEANVMKK